MHQGNQRDREELKEGNKILRGGMRIAQEDGEITERGRRWEVGWGGWERCCTGLRCFTLICIFYDASLRQNTKSHAGDPLAQSFLLCVWFSSLLYLIMCLSPSTLILNGFNCKFSQSTMWILNCPFGKISLLGKQSGGLFILLWDTDFKLGVG